MTATPITRKFDEHADTAIRIVHPDPPTVQLPVFDALLAGPATPMDAVPMPSPRRPVPIWSRFSVVAGAYFLGLFHACAIVRFFW